MFLKTPNSKDPNMANGIGRWTETYPILAGGKLHPATVEVLYILPSYELMSVDVEFGEGHFDEEYRHRDYIMQMATQQGLSDFILFSETQKREKPTAASDPLFQ